MSDPRTGSHDRRAGPDDDLIDELLEHAFAADAEAQGSVLDRLSVRVGALPRVTLAPDSMAARAGKSVATIRSSRYEVSAVLGEGGMGRVFRGRDVDLGRDVALKVLREDRQRSPEAVQRFVEEAQIGGQLQHPGILPVYELGMSSAGPPFIAMRLVEGRTLADELAQRDDRDRARLLRVFEQVCQAVAYAHARSVVHRDLKPSNVMLGAYGEVQVMDWGLAKVLGENGSSRAASLTRERSPDLGEVVTVRSGKPSAQSTTGTVIGTPAYMAPEQARGEVELIDTRSDVFSLGAILCEILTGAPAYVGERVSDVKRKAEAADLADAHDRLERSGADAALVRIGRDCVQAEPQHRPPTAQDLAERVHEYLTSVEARAQRAEVEAAEARVRVDEAATRLVQERRARRLSIALVGAVLLALALGGGGYLWVEHDRLARAQRNASAVADALDEARRHQRAAGAGAQADLAELAAALSAARRAEVLAAPATENAQLLQRARALVAEIEAERERTRQSHARQEANRDTAERLEWIHTRSLDELHKRFPDEFDWARQDADYAAAFRGHDIEVGRLPVAEVAHRVAQSPISAELVIGLQDWSRARARVAGHDDPGHRELLAVVGELYPEPWRQVFFRRDDADALRALARAPDFAEQPASLLGELIGALGAAGDMDLAIDVARRAQGLHPDAFRLHFGLGFWLWKRGAPGDLAEAVACYRAALALNPDSPVAWFFLAWRLFELGEKERPMECLRRLVDLKPELAWAHYELGGGYYEIGDREAAVKNYRQATTMRPDYAEARFQLGATLLELGDLEGAIAELEKVVQLRPKWAMGHANLGAALARRADSTGAVAACEKAVELEPDNGAFWYNVGVARGKRGDLEGTEAAYARAVELQPGYVSALRELGPTRWRLGDAPGALDAHRALLAEQYEVGFQHEVMGFLLYSLGDAAGAVAALREALRAEPKRLSAKVTLAAALQRCGEYADALVILEELREAKARGELPPQLSPALDHTDSCRRGIALGTDLELFLRGEREADTAEDLVALARICRSRGAHLAEARFYRRALRLADGNWDERLDAAGAAIAVGCGDGDGSESLAPAERAQWHAWARQLLTEELQRRANAGADGLRGLRLLIHALRHAPALDSVRGDDSRHREAWRGFWESVEAAMGR